MKQILFIITFICIASKSFGQSEFSSKFKAIPPLNTDFKPKKVSPKTPEVPKITAPNVFTNINILNTKPKPKNSFQIGTTNNFSMAPQNKFVNPGDLIAEKFNKKPDNEEGIVFRKNQNLGNFKTNSMTATVMYRDYGEVDGDAIRVFQNDRMIVTRIYMTGQFQVLDISLEKGFNKIDFEALNQGSVGPNTAEFRVYDDKGGVISASQWNLATGFKATIIITKE